MRLSVKKMYHRMDWDCCYLRLGAKTGPIFIRLVLLVLYIFYHDNPLL